MIEQRNGEQKIVRPLPVKIDGGGRAAAGHRGQSSDCVVRAIAIAAELPYQQVYDAMQGVNRQQGTSGLHAKKARETGSVAKGVYTKSAAFHRYMESIGFEWIPTMIFGQGCTVHLRQGELPMGRLIVSVSKHMVAVIDGVVYDTHDPCRGGVRCVYGYYQRKGSR